MKKIGNTIYSLILFGLIITLLGTVFSFVEAPGGLRLYVVQSGSMEPNIKTGSLAVTKPQSVYKEGDVVSFTVKSNSNFSDSGQTVMHRIVSVSGENEDTSFTTKGDANQGNDPEPVLPSLIEGKVISSLPYVGYAISYARTKIGFVLLIILPAVMIVISEIMNIKREISKMVADKKAKKKPLIAKSESKSPKKGHLAVTKAVAVIVLCLLSVSSGASALLTDEEKAIGVVLSVGTWGNDPELSCEFRGERHMFHFAFDGGYINDGILSYSLVYTADDVSYEVLGDGLQFNGFFEKEICLGGSSDECTPHDDFDRLELNVDLEELEGHEQRQLRCRFRFRENRWNPED